MLFELTHETVFEYAPAAYETFMELRLTPVSDSTQQLLQHRERVTPSRPMRQYRDCYGNTVSYFNMVERQERIEVRFDSVVETYESPYRPLSVDAPSATAAERLLLHDFLQPTSLTEWGSEFREFVRPLERLRGAPVPEVAPALSGEIGGRFRYEGEVTSAQSPISDLLREGAGVCQDFAHLMIAACRYLGYPARYVSGYVLPASGGEATASHAWCEVYDPGRGWLGVDPTHGEKAGERHIIMGVGRDYRDVPPNRGIFRGQAEETMQVHVQLKPITRDDLGRKAVTMFPVARETVRLTRQLRRVDGASILEQLQLAQQQQQQQ